MIFRPLLAGALLAVFCAGAELAFEVASVKPSNAGGGDSTGLKGGGSRGVRDSGYELEHRRFTANGVSLAGLIVKAYSLDSCGPMGAHCSVLAGGPVWLRRDGFDVQAKMPENAADYTFAEFNQGQTPQLALMLQALLAERFQLKAHREKRVLPVYVLTVAKGGAKLKQAAETEESRIAFKPSVQAGGQAAIELFSQNGSMAGLVSLLSKFMNRPVVDRTGLAGRFDFSIDYDQNTDAPGPFSGATGPGMFRAFQDQAGLKLEAARDSIEVLVVDRAVRPSGN